MRKLATTMEKTAQQFCKQLRKYRLTQALNTVKLLKEKPKHVLVLGVAPFSRCVTWAELHEKWQRATKTRVHVAHHFPKCGAADVKPWGRSFHGFTTFQKIEAQAQESSFKNWATRSTNSSYDAFMRTSIDGFAGSDDIDINGDKPLRGYTREPVECLSEDLHFERNR